MMTINLVCVGTLKEQYLKQGVAEYVKRLQKFCKLNILEVAEENLGTNPTDGTISKQKLKEAERLEKHLSGFVVLLDVNGKTFSSEEFAVKLNALSSNFSTITFIIGGSFGVGESIKQKANLNLSFSSFTLPHQLMRLVFLEQLYRAFTISSGITYHK